MSDIEYALKKFILLKYRIVCKDYDLDFDPIYLDKHYGQTAINVDIDNDVDVVDTTDTLIMRISLKMSLTLLKI